MTGTYYGFTIDPVVCRIATEHQFYLYMNKVHVYVDLLVRKKKSYPANWLSIKLYIKRFISWQSHSISLVCVGK